MRQENRPASFATVENVPLNPQIGKQGACNLCKKMHWPLRPMFQFDRLHENAMD
jgi:hypothetical protein